MSDSIKVEFTISELSNRIAKELRHRYHNGILTQQDLKDIESDIMASSEKMARTIHKETMQYILDGNFFPMDKIFEKLDTRIERRLEEEDERLHAEEKTEKERKLYNKLKKKYG